MLAVRQSFNRAKHAGFAHHFYELLLASSPSIRSRFSQTQFEKQRELLIHGVYSMLDFAEGKALGTLAIERLSKTHGPHGWNVTPAMLDKWLSCFLMTLRACDPEFSEELATAWRAALVPGLERLGAAFKQAASG